MFKKFIVDFEKIKHGIPIGKIPYEFLVDYNLSTKSQIVLDLYLKWKKNNKTKLKNS